MEIMASFHPRNTALSLAAVIGLSYILCAFFLAIAPAPTFIFFNSLFHGIDLTKIMDADLSWTSFFTGLITILFSSLVLGWLFATFYNFLSRRGKK